MENTNSKLSLLWLLVVLNYAYGDILTLMYPEDLKAILTGHIGSIEITPLFLLAGAIFVETAIIMVVLSRFLKYRANRRANIAVGLLNAAGVLGSMFIGTPPILPYIFFGVMEIICLSLIVWYAWRWENTP